MLKLRLNPQEKCHSLDAELSALRAAAVQHDESSTARSEKASHLETELAARSAELLRREEEVKALQLDVALSKESIKASDQAVADLQKQVVGLQDELRSRLSDIGSEQVRYGTVRYGREGRLRAVSLTGP